MDRLFEIGDVIRKLRITKAKMALIPFARKAGINKGTLSSIENGKNRNFGAEILEKIADALGMTVPDLYGYLQPSGKGGSIPESEQVGRSRGGIILSRSGKRIRGR